MVPLSVIINLFICLFVTSVCCEARYVGTIELKNSLYISARIACLINFNIKETWMLRLNTWWMFSFLEEIEYLT